MGLKGLGPRGCLPRNDAFDGALAQLDFGPNDVTRHSEHPLLAYDTVAVSGWPMASGPLNGQNPGVPDLARIFELTQKMQKQTHREDLIGAVF
jgi:hypothetical protein